MPRPAVLFGGPSPEHDISIILGLLATRALTESGVEVEPVYWTKSGTSSASTPAWRRRTSSRGCRAALDRSASDRPASRASPAAGSGGRSRRRSRSPPSSTAATAAPGRTARCRERSTSPASATPGPPSPGPPSGWTSSPSPPPASRPGCPTSPWSPSTRGSPAQHPSTGPTSSSRASAARRSASRCSTTGIPSPPTCARPSPTCGPVRSSSRTRPPVYRPQHRRPHAPGRAAVGHREAVALDLGRLDPRLQGQVRGRRGHGQRAPRSCRRRSQPNGRSRSGRWPAASCPSRPCGVSLGSTSSPTATSCTSTRSTRSPVRWPSTSGSTRPSRRRSCCRTCWPRRRRGPGRAVLDAGCRRLGAPRGGHHQRQARLRRRGRRRARALRSELVADALDGDPRGARPSDGQRERLRRRPQPARAASSGCTRACR